jgi:hypothetical protein
MSEFGDSKVFRRNKGQLDGTWARDVTGRLYNKEVDDSRVSKKIPADPKETIDVAHVEKQIRNIQKDLKLIPASELSKKVRETARKRPKFD